MAVNIRFFQQLLRRSQSQQRHRAARPVERKLSRPRPGGPRASLSRRARTEGRKLLCEGLGRRGGLRRRSTASLRRYSQSSQRRLERRAGNLARRLARQLSRFLGFCLCLSLLFPLASCGSHWNRAQISVYNWGSYIDPELLQRFEAETGIHVIYSNYSNNEDLYVKLKHGGSNYDVIVPSDYMIERLIQEDMLRPIDWSQVPNIRHIDADKLRLQYDPEQRYSAPCFWGTVGILYNRKLVSSPPDSWDALWDPQYERQILMMDSSRDSLMVALKRLGYSMNSHEPKELDQALAELQKQYPLVYAYVLDQTKDMMIAGEAAMALMYSGDALDAMFSNEDLDYIIPREGSNLWFDGWAIPKNAQNPEGAQAFINFMLEPRNAAQNADYVGYSLPSQEGRQLQEEDYRESPVAYPELSRCQHMEIFRNPGPFVRRYDDIWQRVKTP